GGTVRLVLDTATGGLTAAAADLTLGKGAIVDPRLARGTAPLGGGHLAAAYDPAARRLTVSDLSLDLGGPRITASGTIDGLDAVARLRDPAAPGSLAAVLTLSATAMPANDLATWWPPGLATHARDWITANIHDGIVDAAHLRATLSLAPSAPPPERATIEA